MVEDAIRSFGLDPSKFKITKIPSGYIHATYKLTGTPSYILQRVNKDVFKKPQLISDNLQVAAEYLQLHHPDYLFLSSLSTVKGGGLYTDAEGYPWRLFAFIENSMTIDKVENEKEAFQASAAFARLTRTLEGVDVGKFHPTIGRFHDLAWRYEQFENALQTAQPDRRASAADSIDACQRNKYLVDRYNELIASGRLRLRVTHNDTKINNILLDADSRVPICVIDLDTLMPGYFIYDVGDMIRTFVCPVTEEERDLSKIVFRKAIYEAVKSGYLSEMGAALNDSEVSLFQFAGQMMTYIMALRMLTDYLNGNIYYQITYPEQNMVRARNQLRLLEVLSAVG
jgi:Ser/Thr protein kinase RdoA (MazF antagonist)